MDVFKTLILDTPTVEGATGTVTSVDLTAGTGISVSGGPITSSGSITVTNTSPDQTVALTGGTGISTSGTYPNFTITNDAPDQTVSIAAGTGISTSGSYPSFTVTNSAPDQTVSIASGTGISVTGTYPSFTVTNSSPSSGGDVVGPASATDNAVVRFDSTTGKLIQNSGVTISDADLLTTTDLTVNDDTVLGSSNTDTVTFNARSASEFTPATDNTYDLGRTGHEWRDLYIDGTANIDSLVADTADINGGTIDGTAVGATTPSTVAATTISSTTGANFATSSGNVGIGTTSPGQKLSVAGTGSYTGLLSTSAGITNTAVYIKSTLTYGPAYEATEDNTDNVGRGIFNFIRGTTTVGQIVTTNTTCAYNSISDYRLKEVTGLLVNSGSFIDALKPKVGKWKSNDSKFVGFLAHEFAEVSPSSVSGEKDAIDADGKPIYQSMQASSSEVMANLVAELQSVRKRLAALEA